MEHGKFKKLHENVKKLIAEKIPINQSVLDIGARDGAFRSYLNQHSYVGIDINPQKPDIIKMDALNITLREKFDYAVSLSCLEHLDIICALKSIRNALKPRGKIIVTVPNAYSWRNLFQRILRGKGGNTRTGHFYSFNVPDIINLFEHCGFEDVKTRIYGVLVPKTNICLARYSSRGEHIIIEADKGGKK